MRPSLLAFLGRNSSGAVLLGIACILAGCATAQAAEVKPLDACHQRAQDVERVCAHQGPSLCKPEKILCAGDVMTFPIK